MRVFAGSFLEAGFEKRSILGQVDIVGPDDGSGRRVFVFFVNHVRLSALVLPSLLIEAAVAVRQVLPAVVGVVPSAVHAILSARVLELLLLAILGVRHVGFARVWTSHLG